MRVLDQLLRPVPREAMLSDYILRRAAELDTARRAARANGDLIARGQMRARVIEALGLNRIPTSRDVQMLDEIVFDEFRVQKLVFESAPGLRVPALLYLPTSPGPHPAVVHPPGHWMEDAKLAAPMQMFNAGLARQGVAVLCYDTIGQGERRMGWHQHGQLAPLLTGFTSLGLMVNDTIAALDILEARDDIDPDRLGAVGASGGGFSSIFTAIVDERVRVAVISSIVNTHLSQLRDAALGTGWDSWVDLCNQVPGLNTIGSMGEILASIAPNRLLVANAEDDPPFPLQGSREVAAEVRQILDRAGYADTFSYMEVPGGHGFASAAMRACVSEYVVTELGGIPRNLRADVPPVFAPQWVVPHNLGSAGSPQSTVPVPSHGTCLDRPVDSNAPVVELARLLANELRAERIPPSADDVAAALGPFPERSPLRARVSRHMTLIDGHAQRVTLHPESGIALDAVLMLPLNWTDSLSPVLVCIDEGGKDSALASPEVARARKLGWAVLALDVRGTGESDASEFELATAAWTLDRDLLNQRVWDLLRAVDFLSERYSSAQQFDKGRIFLFASGAFSLVALAAAALDDRIRGVVVRGPRSLEEALVESPDITPMLYRYGLLRVLDLPDLVRLIEPRTVVIIGQEASPHDAVDLLAAGSPS